MEGILTRMFGPFPVMMRITMHRQGMVSIWFFIGALLLVYGVLITGDNWSRLYDIPLARKRPR